MGPRMLPARRTTGNEVNSMNEKTRNPVAPKKTYESPRILVREPLEAVATVCTTGTSKADPGMCPLGPISS